MMNLSSTFEAIREVDIFAQFSRNKSPLLIGSIVGSLSIVGIWVLGSVTGVDLSDLTRDVVAVEDTHLYVGALSTTGLMLWAATAGICLLGAAVMSRFPSQRETSWFLLCAGMLTALLGFADAFLLHERVFPTYLGLPQKGVYLVYIGSILGFLLSPLRRQSP